MGFDINKAIDRQESKYVMPVLDAKGDIIDGCTITLLSNDSAAARKARRELTDARMEKIARNPAGMLTPQSAQDQERVNCELLAKLTVAWTGFTMGDEDMPCNYANAVKLYTEVIAIREQVDRAVQVRANFIGA